MLRGFYRHYKGGIYRLKSIAMHTETEEQLVIYQCTKSQGVWARPLKMFQEKVTYDGKTVDRFTYIGNNIDDVSKTE